MMKIIEQSVRVLEPYSREDAVLDLKRIEHAGRTCYMSQDKITPDSYVQFIRNLIKRGHTSVLEFASFHVEVITSRDVLAEFTRHRHNSFAVQSQRYVCADKDGEICYIKPEFFLSPEEGSADDVNYVKSRLWEDAMSCSAESYVMLREVGAVAQDARKVLPNSHACVINTRANLRQWLSIFDLRCSSNVYPEMRKLMCMIRDAFYETFPELKDKELV